MATMLSYILTDLSVPKGVLEACLQKVVKGSFNTISVDGDQSTSDTVLVMSSQTVDYKDSDLVEFEKAMLEVCTGLAEDIVRNGNETYSTLLLLRTVSFVVVITLPILLFSFSTAYDINIL
jgi:glutamate N-acetyltransferase / amino-acid N-acetyltransferase